MNEALLERVRKLDQEYFGNRDIRRLIRAMDAQIRSMAKAPTLANVHKQAGDLLFVLVALARNNGWDLTELLTGPVVMLEQRREERHYFESHVTLEPVLDEERLVVLRAAAEGYGFHVATLLMQKRPADTPERSQNDSFCTARGVSYSDLHDQTVNFCRSLEEQGFKVWRYKIESTLLDSRYDDSIFPLDRTALPAKELNPRAPADGALAGRREL